MDLTYASFLRRLGAFIVDQFLLMILGFFVGLIIGILVVAAGGSVSEESKPIFNIIGIFITWLYYASCESSQAQATLGKALFGMKVVGIDGEKISFGRATGRFFGKIISGIALLIGYLAVIWHPKKQAWHDSMAGTYVVMK